MGIPCEAISTSAKMAPYRQRRPEKTILHRVVRTHLETFLARARETCLDDDPIPAHVEQAFRKYLSCGVLSHGFARIRCESCGHDYLLAFSCKQKAFCPSCSGRRMVETAAHLVDNVLPRTPFRQWVITFPKRVRWHLRNRPEVASSLLRIFLRAVETTIRNRSPGAPTGSRIGAVSFRHLFGSSLNPHPHFHCLITNGVFASSHDHEAVFHEALDLSPRDVRSAQVKVRKRTLAFLERHDYLEPGTVADMLSWQHGGGFSLDASVLVQDWDRAGLERLCRYCARPTFALERLEQIDENTIVYRLKKPAPDGSTALVLSPMELLARLAELVPLPRKHGIIYSGVLAPNARLRKLVIASAGPSAALLAHLREAEARMGLSVVEQGPSSEHDREPRLAVSDQTYPPDKPMRIYSRCWALLLARIFEVLPLLCPRCSKPMRIIAFITDPPTIERILTHIGETPKPPPVMPARGPPQQEFEFDQTANMPEDDFDQTASMTQDDFDQAADDDSYWS